MDDKFLKVLTNIDTVQGFCENCRELSVLIGIVQEYYRCTNCGCDTKQHINGKISYLKISEKEKEFLRNQHGKT